MSEDNKLAVGIKKLTPKEWLFVDYYVGQAEFNAALACRLAGYKDTPAIYATAYELLRKPHIEAAINDKLKERAKDHEALLRSLIARYQSIAFSNVTDFMEFKGRSLLLRDSKELPRHLSGAIKSVKQTKEGLQIDLHDAKGAADSLARILGAFTDNTREVGEEYESLVERIAREENAKPQ